MTAKEFITVDNLECMFSDATYGVDYFTIEIPKAQKQLANTIRKMQPDICRETLWAEIVVKGANLTVIDNEDDKKYTINRQLIADRYALWQEQDPRGYADFCEETGDAWTALNWLQIIIFKEIIYA